MNQAAKQKAAGVQPAPDPAEYHAGLCEQGIQHVQELFDVTVTSVSTDNAAKMVAMRNLLDQVTFYPPSKLQHSLPSSSFKSAGNIGDNANNDAHGSNDEWEHHGWPMRRQTCILAGNDQSHTSRFSEGTKQISAHVLWWR